MNPEFIVPTCLIKEAYVLSEKAVEGRIPIAIDSHVSDKNATPGEQYYAYIVTPSGMQPKLPKKGTKGIVIFEDIEISPGDTGYWMGAIKNKFNQKDPAPSKSEVSQIENDNKDSRVAVADGTAGLYSKESKAVISPEGFEVDVTSGQIAISKEGINLVNKDSAGEIRAQLLISPYDTAIESTGRFRVQSRGNIAFRTENNNFVITGLLDKNSSEKGENAYRPIDTFFLKSKKAIFNTTKGPLYMFGGNVAMKLAGGKVTGGGGKPGKGPDATFAVEAVQGDIELQAGDGDIAIIANDKMQSDKVTIRCGATINPMRSWIEMKGRELLVKNQTAPGLDCSITLAQQKVEIDAFKDISLNSQTGKITIDAVQNIEVEAQAQIKMKANAKIEIEASTIIKMKANVMLDLKDCRIIDAGQKTVAQSAGPFCALPVCPITGMGHVGDKAIG